MKLFLNKNCVSLRIRKISHFPFVCQTTLLHQYPMEIHPSFDLWSLMAGTSAWKRADMHHLNIACINMHELGCMKHSCACREKDGCRWQKQREWERELGQCVVLFPVRDCRDSFTSQLLIIRLHSAVGVLCRKLYNSLLIKEKEREREGRKKE